jgi:hypothetical protein
MLSCNPSRDGPQLTTIQYYDREVTARRNGGSNKAGD